MKGSIMTDAARKDLSWIWICGSIVGTVLAAVALIGVLTDWPAWYVLTMGTSVVAALGWWIAKHQGGLLGPHFFYDLVRLARRSRTRDLRVLYGMALLLGLGLIYWVQFP